MFLEWLERQRQKPKHVRARTAFLSAVAVTAVIGVLWSFTLPARFSELSNFADDAQEGLENDQHGFDDLLGDTRESARDVIDQMNASASGRPDTPQDSEGESEENPLLFETESAQEPAPQQVILEVTKEETSE